MPILAIIFALMGLTTATSPARCAELNFPVRTDYIAQTVLQFPKDDVKQLQAANETFNRETFHLRGDDFLVFSTLLAQFADQLSEEQQRRYRAAIALSRRSLEATYDVNPEYLTTWANAAQGAGEQVRKVEDRITTLLHRADRDELSAAQLETAVGEILQDRDMTITLPPVLLDNGMDPVSRRIRIYQIDETKLRARLGLL